jgi:hypothetical protein
MPGHYAEHGRDHDRVLKGQGPEAAPSTPLEACAAAMTGGTTVESRPASLPTRVPLWGFAERLDAVERTELVLDSLEGQRTHCLAGVDCMDPDENRPSLDISDRFKVGVLGSRCG